MFVRLIQQYFNYTKKEALGFIIISAIMLLVLTLPFFISFFVPSQAEISKHDIKMLDSLMTKLENSPSYETFEFDPNTLNKDSFLMLGLSPVVVENIMKYRKAGGDFNYKEDFKKIYGLKDKTYQRLVAYISLPNRKTEHAQEKKEVEVKPEKPIEADKIIDLNTADAKQLQTINGVGEVYSERIVKYRYILGGFVKKKQLEEVYGLSDFALNNLMKHGKIGDSFTPKKVDINKDEAYTLQYHPYISKEMATKIIDAKKKDIHLKSGHDLKEFLNIDDSVLVKLLPYIEFE